MKFFYFAYQTWIIIGRKKWTIIIVSFALIFVIILLSALQSNYNIFPSKQSIKELVKSQLEVFISNDEVTLNEIYFDSVDAKMFRTRQEDPVGFFAYIEKDHTIIDINGIEHKNQLEYYRSEFGENYNPESKIKWAYILTGSYTATHKEYGEIDGEFCMTYVDIGRDKCLTDYDYGPSEDMLRKEVTKDVTAYTLLKYDIQPNADVEITYIEETQLNNYYINYTVYGVVTAKDKYGETYSGNFTAQYETNCQSQFFERENLEVSTFIKQPD